MDHGSIDRFPLQSSREPNPLRPYYVPPSIGPANTNATTSPSQGARATAPATSAYRRDYLPDIDIDVTAATGEAWGSVRDLVNALAWRYTSVLLAQPFEVGKTVLQVALPPSESATALGQTSHPLRRRRSRRRLRDGYESETRRAGASRYDGHDSAGSESPDSAQDSASDMSEGMPEYFTSSAPISRSQSPRRRARATRSHHHSSRTSADPSPKGSRSKRSRSTEDPMYKLRLKRVDSVLHAIGELYRTSGAVGLWRASNATFLYSILLRATDSFIRSLLFAILGLPELELPSQTGLSSGVSAISGVDLSESQSPFPSLFVFGLSSCLTGLLLAPLDIVRTRLVLSPTNSSPRGVWPAIKSLPSLFIPSTLAVPTVLYHSVPTLFSSSMPLLFRWYARLSPDMTPSFWSIATFASSLSELFVRLPLETVLRRAQAQYIKTTYPTLPLILEPAPHKGVFATVHSIIYAEGETTTKDPRTGMLRTTRGQGTAGLVRGWRVGFWGLVGVWGAGSLGNAGGNGRGEF